VLLPLEPENHSAQSYSSRKKLFQITSNQWIISSPNDFLATIKCQSTFTSIAVRSLSTVTVPPGCNVDLKSHMIQPSSATIDFDLETIHHKWSWDLDVLFPYYPTDKFEAIISHLKNVITVVIDNIRAAVTTAKYVSEGEIKTVHLYFEN
jgi:hypothetical protein